MTSLLAILLLTTSPPTYTMKLFESAYLEAMNSKGEAVGGMAPSVKWDGTSLVRLPKGFDEATGINDAGSIIGIHWDGHKPCILVGGVKGSLVDLPLYQTDRQGRALAINSKGMVVGESGGLYEGHPVCWLGGSVQYLGLLEGDTVGYASGVNDNGWIVGTSRNSTRIQPFLYRDDKMETLPLPEGSVFGSATSINNKGTIVGWCKIRSTPAACCWTNGKPAILGNLSGFEESRALAINISGDIVGHSGPRVYGPGEIAMLARIKAAHAFIWKDGFMYDLNMLVPSKPGDLLINEAMAINDSGQILAKAMRKGIYYSLILTPIKK